MGRCWGWDGGWTGGVADQPEKKEVQRHGPPPCGMPGVVHGSALRARRTGLRGLRLGLLTRVHARRLRVHVDAGRDAGRGAATSGGDFQPRRLPRRREFMRQLFVVGSLDKQIQNERELIHLASAGRRGAILYLCGEY